MTGKMNRLLSLMLAALILLVPIIPVSAASETSSDNNVAENVSADDGINYKRYPAVTQKQAIKLIRTAIKQHKKTLRFSIKGSLKGKNSFEYAEKLLYKAYGKIPDFYELGQYFQFTDVYNSIPEKGCYEYRFGYFESKKQCDAFEKKLKRVEKSLNLKGLSNKKKAYIIYKWISRNVKYDYKKAAAEFTDGSEASAYNALMKKKAVCQGISALYYRMLRDAGVQACVVRGGAGSSCGNRTTGYNQRHVWVLVKIGKKWYNTDPTWDLGNKRFNYFLKTDKAFKRGHRRDREYNTKAFRKAHPMGKKDLM